MTQDQLREIEACQRLLARGYSAADMREVGHAEAAIREALRRAVEGYA